MTQSDFSPYLALVKRGHKNLLLVPIAFVNDHIETLHELDIEYAHDVILKSDKHYNYSLIIFKKNIYYLWEKVGKEVGAERIARCSAPNAHPLFIEALADVVSTHLDKGARTPPAQLMFRCPKCDNPTCGKMRAWINKISSTSS